MKPTSPEVGRTDDSPFAELLSGGGRIFAVFDERTQDSGNVSYGVDARGRRFFVKTAGRPNDDAPRCDHAERVALLRNAVRLAKSADHPALPRLRRIVEYSAGPALVYDWVEGDLVRGSLDRIRGLPARDAAAMLTDLYDLHAHLAERGWIAVDFYDGAMIYDFDRHRLHIVDLDHYHPGPFTNRMGRMFGSTRFMAPEEFELGARIDERTTVFTMGRAASVLLSDNSLDREPFRGTDAQYAVMKDSCREYPGDRFQTVAELRNAWIGSIENWNVRRNSRSDL